MQGWLSKHCTDITYAIRLRQGNQKQLQQSGDTNSNSYNQSKLKIEKQNTLGLRTYYSEKLFNKTISKETKCILTSFQKNIIEKYHSRNIINIKKSCHFKNNSLCMMINPINPSFQTLRSKDETLHGSSLNYHKKKDKWISTRRKYKKQVIQPLIYILHPRQLSCKGAKPKPSRVSAKPQSARLLYVRTEELLNKTKATSVNSNKKHSVLKISQ